jgi:hypothetical protein
MIALVIAGLLTAAPLPSQTSEPEATETRGVAGVCIRWDRQHPSRVAQAEIVRTTGNRTLDTKLRRAIPRMDWPVGVDDYRGQWLGIWMAVGGAASPDATVPLPDCSHLRDRSWAPAPVAPAA